MGPRGVVFSPPEEELLLLLSKTETGLEVWNWLWEDLLLRVEFSFPRVNPPPENESSTKVESHSSCTISSYCETVKQKEEEEELNEGKG